uniref:Uncharacterized protein n=1 Tax=Ditylenchus dipsaci TaxID=166011 RepID=A0A915DMJ9_9BILA
MISRWAVTFSCQPPMRQENKPSLCLGSTAGKESNLECCAEIHPNQVLSNVLIVLRDLKVYCCVARFNEMFIFHRNSLRQMYVFEIWEDRPLKDKQLARCSLNVLTDNDCINCALDMQQTSYSSSSSTNGLNAIPKAIVEN